VLQTLFVCITVCILLLTKNGVLKMSISKDEIKLMRQKMNMSGERFASHCGISRTTLSLIECGRTPITSGLEVRFLYGFASYCYVRSIELPSAWSYKEAISAAISA
jgi:transcriptional regulator with XRE-family HTH domain